MAFSRLVGSRTAACVKPVLKIRQEPLIFKAIMVSYVITLLRYQFVSLFIDLETKHQNYMCNNSGIFVKFK